MLYLPPGVPHHGEAVDACMTFSIGMRAPSQAELIVRLRRGTGRGAARGSALCGRRPGRAARRLRDRRARVRPRRRGDLHALQSLDPARKRDWFGRFITRYRDVGRDQRRRRGRRASTPWRNRWPRAACCCAIRSRGRPGRARTVRLEPAALLFVSGEAFPMARHSAHVLAAYEALDDAALAKLDAGRARSAGLSGPGRALSTQASLEDTPMNTPSAI